MSLFNKDREARMVVVWILAACALAVMMALVAFATR